MDTEKLKELLAAATPRPWAEYENGEGTVYVGSDVDGAVCFVTGNDGEVEANAALIVAAVNALPTLLAELEAARRDAKRWRHARTILAVEGIENAPGNVKGHIACEEGNLAADAAIDTAMEA